jgi:catechol 2,3-dioxygenase-like lactoylglutathione lyase family enzyme
MKRQQDPGSPVSSAGAKEDTMLSDKNAMATVSVRDMQAARRFYGETLGLKPDGMDMPDVVTYRSGNSRLVVYRSEFAGTNKATAATWGIGSELESEVRRLKIAGVAFEHYDLPGLRRDGDIHIAGDFRAAWFKDPDGNILHINSA